MFQCAAVEVLSDHLAVLVHPTIISRVRCHFDVVVTVFVTDQTLHFLPSEPFAGFYVLCRVLFNDDHEWVRATTIPNFVICMRNWG